MSFLPKHIYKKLKGLEKLEVPEIELSPEVRELHNLYKTSSLDLTSDIVHIGEDKPADRRILQTLESLKPFRKGKYQLFDTFIDSEWDCSIRFNKLKTILDFNQKTILDVGCNNGYYGLRSVGEGASFVLGTDINEKTIKQFKYFTGFMDVELPIRNLHLNFTSLPEKNVNFDIILYMGVLYHTTDPISHLSKLNHLLDKDGLLVLETIVPADGSELIFSSSSYANMKNVWFVAGFELVKTWLIRTGFTDIELVEQRPLQDREQRRTIWADHPSLAEQTRADGKTIEGLPFYDRAIILARKK